MHHGHMQIFLPIALVKCYIIIIINNFMTLMSMNNTFSNNELLPLCLKQEEFT